MTGGRLWTEEEENRLCEMWGHYSIDSIARKLGRSVAAIDEQIVRLNDSDRHCVTTAKINVMAIRKRVRDLPTIWVQADVRNDQECARQKI